MAPKGQADRYYKPSAHAGSWWIRCSCGYAANNVAGGAKVCGSCARKLPATPAAGKPAALQGAWAPTPGVPGWPPRKGRGKKQRGKAGSDKDSPDDVIADQAVAKQPARGKDGILKQMLAEAGVTDEQLQERFRAIEAKQVEENRAAKPHWVQQSGLDNRLKRVTVSRDRNAAQLIALDAKAEEMAKERVLIVERLAGQDLVIAKIQAENKQLALSNIGGPGPQLPIFDLLRGAGVEGPGVELDEDFVNFQASLAKLQGKFGPSEQPPSDDSMGVPNARVPRPAGPVLVNLAGLPAGSGGAEAAPTMDDSSFDAAWVRYAALCVDDDAELGEYEEDGVTPKQPRAPDLSKVKARMRECFVEGAEPRAKKVCVQQRA